MSKKRQVKYACISLITIALGLISRKISFIPSITGDLLYAVMMYWIFRSVLINKKLQVSLLLAISFCFLIEFLQLVQTQPFIYIRNHPFLKLIFGQGFLWTDLVAYAIGSFSAYQIDKIFITKNNTSQ